MWKKMSSTFSFAVRSTWLEDLSFGEIGLTSAESRYFPSKHLVPMTLYICQAACWSSPDNLAEQCCKTLLSLWNWNLALGTDSFMVLGKVARKQRDWFKLIWLFKILVLNPHWCVCLWFLLRDENTVTSLMLIVFPSHP